MKFLATNNDEIIILKNQKFETHSLDDYLSYFLPDANMEIKGFKLVYDKTSSCGSLFVDVAYEGVKHLEITNAVANIPNLKFFITALKNAMIYPLPVSVKTINDVLIAQTNLTS